MKNLTYSQLIELAPKDRPFQIEVEFIDIANPISKIDKIIYWAMYDITKTEPFVVQDGYRLFKEEYRKKRYTLIDPRYQRPEVLKAGQKVRIIEDNEITNTGTIYWVYDNLHKGLCYDVEIDNKQHIITKFPHYCVMPVEEEEEQEIPELENTLEQLDNLVSKAQDIISKYKK
jgi:hypothetical protein